MAKEYIEREALIDETNIAPVSMSICMNVDECKGRIYERERLMRIINAMPAADVMPVVRCGECEHYKKRYWANGRCYGTFCDIWNRDHGKTFFCERGIKREKAERAERREGRCMRNL